MNIEKKIEMIKQKTDLMMSRIDPKKPLMPRGVSVEGKYTDFMDTLLQPEWTYSFFLANVCYMYIYYREEKYLNFLEACVGPYTDYLFHNEAEIGHDTGFLYSLYAVALYKVTGKDIYRQLALKAADEVAKRVRMKAGHIQAFFDLRLRGVTDEISFMIVDDMMNNLILMWAYKETGHSFYRDVYEAHLATSIRYLIRSDYSVCHGYHFDARTGEPVGEMNFCGFGIGSHWARGTAWMIYGLTKALEYTGKKERYMQPLAGVATKYFESLKGAVVPPYDFRIPEDSSMWLPCDTSAALIISSAFEQAEKLELKGYAFEKGYKYKEAVLKELEKEEWLGKNDDEYVINYGHGDGCAWGDFFYTEILMKKQLGENFVDFWF